MKTTYLFVIALIGCMYNADAQKIYTVKNGVTYRITGSEGVIFKSDGTIIIQGEEIWSQVNLEEFKALGNEGEVRGDEPIKLPCGTSQALLPSADGKGGIYQSINGNKCGPMEIRFINGIKMIKCLNHNNFLCSAKFCHDSNDCVYVNYDCN
jgi:hypothetical protein